MNTVAIIFLNYTGEGDDGSSVSSDSPLDSDIELNLEHQLDQNLKMIHKQYAAYVDCILTIVEKKGITARRLSAYLLNLPAFSNNKDKMLLSDLKAELKEAEEVTDIFMLLSSKYASFLDYEIFETIRERYGANYDDEQGDLDYPIHLKSYIKRHSIKQFINLNPELINPKLQKLGDTKHLRVKINIKRTQNLHTLKEVTRAVANILGLRPAALQLCGIKKGCVCVTYSIPAPVADIIFTDNLVFSSEQQHQFQAASVKWLEFNGYKYYFNPPGNA